jgi:6-phosphogluconolactonase
VPFEPRFQPPGRISAVRLDGRSSDEDRRRLSDEDGEEDEMSGRETAAILVHPAAHAASRAAAESFAQVSRAAVEARGRFSVALSGGSAPWETYRILGEEPFRSSVPWEAVHLFWGDERCVPPGHPRSNFGMANEVLVSRIPIPPGNVHRMRGEMRPEEGAEEYRQELEAFFGPGVPRFDLIHLGVGPDAHTCSLFPFDELLRERDRTVGTALHRPLGEWRVTLTVPVLNAAARIEVLAFGKDKAAVVRTVIEGPLDPFRLPIQLVRPGDGELVWRLDEGAASGLERNG